LPCAAAVRLYMARYTQLRAVHDQDSRTVRMFISHCCNRRRGKHATVSCVVNFVNCLKSVSVAILMENVLILFCGVGVVCFVCFRSRSHPVPHRGERVEQRTMCTLNRADC
jgi:hypothetical protein